MFPQMYDMGMLDLLPLYGALCYPAGCVCFVPCESRVSKAEQRWHCTVGFGVWPSPVPQVASPAVAQIMENPVS